MTFRQPPPPRCATCAARPELERAPEVPWWRCPACRGDWLEENQLHAALASANRGPCDLFEYNDESPRRPCPVCDEIMVLVWIGFIRFDRCETHGIWFDAGALERLIAGEAIPEDARRQLRYAEEQRKKETK